MSETWEARFSLGPLGPLGPPQFPWGFAVPVPNWDWDRWDQHCASGPSGPSAVPNDLPKNVNVFSAVPLVPVVPAKKHDIHKIGAAV